MKRLQFHPTAPRRGTLTPRWVVKSARDQFTIGMIVFRAPWRRFVFEPGPDTVFDAECLGEIVAFLDERMTERKAELKSRKS